MLTVKKLRKRWSFARVNQCHHHAAYRQQ